MIWKEKTYSFYVILLSHFLQTLPSKWCDVGYCHHDSSADSFIPHPFCESLDSLYPDLEVLWVKHKNLHAKHYLWMLVEHNLLQTGSFLDCEVWSLWGTIKDLLYIWCTTCFHIWCTVFCMLCLIQCLWIITHCNAFKADLVKYIDLKGMLIHHQSRSSEVQTQYLKPVLIHCYHFSDQIWFEEDLSPKNSLWFKVTSIKLLMKIRESTSADCSLYTHQS